MRNLSVISRLCSFGCFTTETPIFRVRRPKLVTLSTSANTGCPEWSLNRAFSESGKRLGNSQKVWNIGKINHIALATPDLKKSSAFYRNVLGANVSEEQPVPDHGVTVVFVTLGDTKIELLHPLGKRSPIQSFLDKNKDGGMHHICIEVDNIHSAMQEMRDNNIRLLSETSRIGAHGKPVVFLHPKDCDGVLVELEEA